MTSTQEAAERNRGSLNYAAQTLSSLKELESREIVWAAVVRDRGLR